MDRPVNYEQTDRRWDKVVYSNHGDKNQTIGNSGCGPTCAAMGLATLTGKNFTPIDTAAWAVENGHRTDNNGTNWAYFKPQFAAYGLKCDDYIIDASKAIEAVKKGFMVVALALAGIWTSSGHYILAYGVDGDYILVNDPNSEAQRRERAPLSTFRAQCSKFWIIREEWQMKTQQITVDMNGKPTKLTSIVYRDENYVRLRDLADADKGDKLTVDWNAAAKKVIIKSK